MSNSLSSLHAPESTEPKGFDPDLLSADTLERIASADRAASAHQPSEGDDFEPDAAAVARIEAVLNESNAKNDAARFRPENVRNYTPAFISAVTNALQSGQLADDALENLDQVTDAAVAATLARSAVHGSIQTPAHLLAQMVHEYIAFGEPQDFEALPALLRTRILHEVEKQMQQQQGHVLSE